LARAKVLLVEEKATRLFRRMKEPKVEEGEVQKQRGEASTLIIGERKKQTKGKKKENVTKSR